MLYYKYKFIINNLKKMNKKTIFLICLIIYLILIFGIEFAYRQKLYELSVEYIEKLSQEGFVHHFFWFFSVLYIIAIIAIGMLVVLLCYPLNIFFCHLSILLFSIFMMCIFKSLYANSRPYWDIFLKWKYEQRTLPKPTECDGEFGNPSGHAMLNMYSLYVWHLFISSRFVNKIENNMKRNLIKCLTLVLTLFFMVCVVYSRIQRQVHSFNQIIHGSLIGIGMFFLFCYIFDYLSYDLKNFIDLLYRYKFIMIPIWIILYALSIIFGLTIHNSKEKEFAELLAEICKFKEGNMFGKNTALTSSLIFIHIGAYLGLIYMKWKINNSGKKEIFEDVMNYWNKGKILHIIAIVLFSFVMPSVLLLPYVFIHDYVLRFILFLIGNLLFGFLSFGPLFCFISEKLKRPEIEEKQSLISSEQNGNFVSDV